MAQRGLSANEFSGALISMMARSTRFKQRPDTLMQGHHRQFAEPSCDARPDHTLGQTQTTNRLGDKSASPPTADITSRELTVREVPLADDAVGSREV